MSRIFLSHATADSRAAIALKQWLVEQDASLANEIFLDVDPHTGLETGTRWKDALRRANARCEAVVCLLSENWEASHECKVEYRTAENLNKQIFCARLEPSTGDELTSEWQRCDLFGDGPVTLIDTGNGPAVSFATDGLYRLREGIRSAGIGADSFRWPPTDDPQRAPYRGWEPLDAADAAVFFGRDAQIVRALDAIRGMRRSGTNALFVVLGPSGTGKSSFLRAGLLPRLGREDRRFALLDIVRPERSALTGQSGLAAAIFAARKALGLSRPSLGDVKAACAAGDVDQVTAWLTEMRNEAAERLLDRENDDQDAPVAPTLVLPLDQAEELFSADAGEQADTFLRLLAGVTRRLNALQAGLVVAATIRTDRYELMQTHPALTGVGAVLFDELKPMPPTEFKEVIVGPAHRATDAGQPLRVAPELVERLLIDSAEGADTLPMLALTLSRLYTDYGDSGELSLAHYEALGGMRRVVQTEIDEVLAVDPRQRATELAALRAAFIPWLATINPDNDQPMRRVARWSNLPDASRPLIDALVAKRLMVKDNRDGQTVVEVALESLLRQWDQLAGWLRDERKDLKEADDIEHCADAWEANDRNPAWLLQGSRLAEAVVLLEKPGFHERLARTAEFLAASRESEEERRAAEEQQRQAELRAAQERANHAQEKQATAEAHSAILRKRSQVLRRVVAGTAAVAVLAIVASLLATSAHSQAQTRFRQATAARLESEAQGMLDSVRPGGDARALQQVLAAHLIDGENDDAIYSAAVSRHNLVKIIPAESPVYGVAFSPDGSRVASASEDHMVRVWDRVTGNIVGEPLSGLPNAAFSVAFSPDGRRLAAASDDSVQLWSAEVGAASRSTLRLNATKVKQVVFSPDGRRLATASSDGTIRLWDANTGDPLPQKFVGHRDAVNSIAFSPDGRRLASGSNDKTVRLWDAETATPIGEPLSGHKDAVTAVDFSPDGHRVASGSKDRTVYLWDPDTQRPVAGPMIGHNDIVHEIAFSPDGRMLASAGGDNVVWLWDTATGSAIGRPLTGHDFEVYSLAFSPDARYVVTGSYDQTVRLWDVGDMILADQGELWTVALSPDGNRVASAGDDGSVRLWDTTTGKPVGPRLVGGHQAIEVVTFSPDGRWVAAGGDDKTIRIWDVETGKPVGRPLTGHTDLIWTLAFSPDGSRLVSGSADRTIRIWDTSTGEAIGKPITGHTSDVYGVAFSPNGSRVVSASVDRTIRLWDAATGQEIGKPITGHTNTVDSVAFSPDGKRIVSGASDGLVRLWDADTGGPIGKPLIGHNDTVGSVAYGRDGQMIVSGGYSGEVRLWDADSGRTIGGPMRGHADLVVGVAINSDRHLVVSAGDDGILRLWSTQATEGDLCAKLTSNMSRAQWNEWISPDIDYIPTCPDLPIAPD
ncbi:TIR domain-containing protein [Mycobacterium barrassiae]|uniref:nSTAND1 domain-containing NTPase n=1 Tax=Mycobacterium barrassiae TaxID=319709 RepID=UPI0022658B9A|nr:TIR domain-containing protein [Mycobacterium barrassiae]MCV7300548.1 TIR domain-containing protein [Mycobacterium barrassiae]